MVQLKVVILLLNIILILFQYLMVQLKDLPPREAKLWNIFQYLMVQLKEVFPVENHFICIDFNTSWYN